MQTGQAKIVQALLARGANVNAASYTEDGKVRSAARLRWPAAVAHAEVRRRGVCAMHGRRATA